MWMLTVKPPHTTLTEQSYNIFSLASVLEMPDLPLSPPSHLLFQSDLPQEVLWAFTVQHDLTGLYLIHQIFIWH